MAESVPTLTIVNPDAPDEHVIINASEYDPSLHVLWEQRLSSPAAQPAPSPGGKGSVPPVGASPSGGPRAPLPSPAKEDQDAPEKARKKD